MGALILSIVLCLSISARSVISFNCLISLCYNSIIINIAMSACKTCLSGFKKNQLKINCTDCKSDFHAKCVKVTQADLDYLQEQDAVWRCEPCCSVRRKSFRLDYGSQDGSVTLEDIMKLLKGIQEEQKTIIADFNKSFDMLHEKIEEKTTTLEDKMKKIEDYINETEKLKVENLTLKKKVIELESRVDDLENYSRRNCIEIQGIPEEKKENVLDVVKNLGNVLGVNITNDMVDACHRVGKATEDRPRGIILKLVRRTDKEELIKKRKERKREFSTRHLGLPSDFPVYLNDSLSPSRRRLLGRARQLKKDKSYAFLWLRNGNILLRKEEGSPVIEIRCQADLEKL